MIVRWLTLFLVLVMAAFAGYFAVINPHDVLVVLPGSGLLFGSNGVHAPLFGLVFVTLCLGFIIGVLSNWSAHRRCRRRLARRLHQIESLEEELTNLRNLPLDNDVQF